MRLALLLLAVLATGWSELMHRPAQQIPATITEALTVSKGTYSAHFRKQPGKNVDEWQASRYTEFKILSILQVVPMNCMDTSILTLSWNLWSM